MWKIVFSHWKLTLSNGITVSPIFLLVKIREIFDDSKKEFLKNYQSKNFFKIVK